MKTFEYAATDASGATVRGRAHSESELGLDRELESKGLTLQSARVAGSERTRSRFKFSHVELISVTTQLSTVTSAGVPLVEGLASIGLRLDGEEGRHLIEEMVAGLEAGERLSEMMDRYPRAFPVVYRSTVRAGEASGSLDSVLDRLARYLEWAAGMRATAMQASIYPCMLMIAMFGLVIVLLTVLLPKIMKLFPGGRDQLPTETRIVLAASDFLRDNAIVLGVALVVAVVCARRLSRTRAGQEFIHARLLSVPRLGKLMRQIATSRFASTASILQSAGCDVFTVLQISGESCGNAAMQASFARTTEAVRRGATISEGLDRERHVDPLLKQMVGVGEKSGQLDTCLDRLVKYYDDEVPRSVKRFLSVLEPTLLLLSGAIVAFILLAALMPIFKMYENIG